MSRGENYNELLEIKWGLIPWIRVLLREEDNHKERSVKSRSSGPWQDMDSSFHFIQRELWKVFYIGRAFTSKDWLIWKNTLASVEH